MLLHSRFDHVARNTIDYWMKPDSANLSAAELLDAWTLAPWLDRATVQLYLHVPYCAQKCSFCAFSGGNSLSFKMADRYADLLIWQMRDLLGRSQAKGKPIASVNIGGGSPDLLRAHIGKVLRAVRDLPGCTNSTEISVEFTLSTVTDEFIDALIEHQVTKASFGVQVLDPAIRRHLHMPSALRNMDETCEKLARGVPIINADLMTGFPGQTVESVLSDLECIVGHPHINAVSSYLLTPGAAPKLVGDIQAGKVPAQPRHEHQALFRLHTYATLLRRGWIRKGTNTYMNPDEIPERALSIVAGNECIGARRYEDFLIGAGAQAISSIPGARAENIVDIDAWSAFAERGEHGFSLDKSSLSHQRDMALWVFPLMGNGLAVSEYEALRESGALDEAQMSNFRSFIEEGLIFRSGDRYQLTITGEVFMGHLVRNLKKEADRGVLDDYIDEGYTLGQLVATDKIVPKNATNNRQLFRQIVRGADSEH
ncbi:radical SAM protein [Sorangium sp. So ce363]|uniref:radical SAM protein n=1 Tax=Sorangium sp. So ce363 TaxID=3133304 RepID=UPI003F6260C1